MEEWKVYKNFGLLWAVLVTFLMFAPENDDIPDSEDITESDFLQEDGKSENLYSKIWKYKLSRERLIYLIKFHVFNVL
jgi:hypothetical protein